MRIASVRDLIVVTVSLSMTHAFAASATIGIATAKGNFRVDDSTVAGNATLFEGTSVETGLTTGELRLASARVAMASMTKGAVYQDHLSLEQGKIQWTGGSAFRATAGGLEVVGAGVDSTALVVRKGDELQVASLAGTVNVVRAGGELIRAVPAGMAFSFGPDPQGATAGPDEDKDKKKKKKKAAAAVGTGAAGGAAAGTAAGAGASAAVTALAIGAVAAAVAVPVAVVATRDDGTASK
jgi:hypothetical protein